MGRDREVPYLWVATYLSGDGMDGTPWRWGSVGCETHLFCIEVELSVVGFPVSGFFLSFIFALFLWPPGRPSSLKVSASVCSSVGLTRFF